MTDLEAARRIAFLLEKGRREIEPRAPLKSDDS